MTYLWYLLKFMLDPLKSIKKTNRNKIPHCNQKLDFFRSRKPELSKSSSNQES